MPIDLSDRIIQPPKEPLRLHPIRRIVQLAVGAGIIILPLVNGLRVDVTSGYFWLLGQRFTAQNIILLFYACALGVLLLLSVSMVYGRWWCGWVCPQTLASDFGDSLKSRLETCLKSAGSFWQRFSYPLWATLMIAMSVATSAAVLSYFYPPARVWSAFAHPLADHRVALHLAIVTTVIAADLLFLRRNFCRRGCPYGLMLSVIGDTKTMTVRYLWERGEDCISCGKCVTVCPMGIDIKDGANQMECIGCGECIDACNDILPMIKSNPKPGLIELRYGIDPMRKTSRLTFAQKIGLWDLRRAFLCAVVVILGSGLVLTMFGTRPTTVTVIPSGTIAGDEQYLIENYDVTVANGKPHDETFGLGAFGLKGISVYLDHPTFSVGRGAQRTVRVTVAAPSRQLVPGKRYPIEITLISLDHSKDRQSVGSFFYVPETVEPVKAG
jgi:cytochrome c oxidase accessory protein FixG